MMYIHNENFDFSKDAPIDHKLSFKGIPKRELLPSNTKLYRFLTPNVNQLFSPFWFTQKVYSEILRHANVSGESIQEIARSRHAVTHEWNPEMSQFCIIVLNCAAYAWVGPVRHQTKWEVNLKNVLLVGGLEQAYLPNLSQTGINSKIARLVYHGPIEYP